MGVKSARISVLLSGAPNDEEVLQTSLRFAAREACELHVILAATYPKGTPRRHQDTAIWEVVERGLSSPQLLVEGRHQDAEPPSKVRVS